LCQELADHHWMLDYVERQAKIVMCGVKGTNCNEKEVAYLEKMKSQQG
jgi:hypothetical protein